MNNVIKINDQILTFLNKKRRIAPNLYFLPRKINNENRLAEGYWFIGNKNYVYISFWEGNDWKEKIHNIGFVVRKNNTSYIELSAQDSKVKAKFLDLVASNLKGFNKHVTKNKWSREYQGTDYLKNLNDFLEHDKPKIDKLIEQHKPKGITFIEKKDFSSYLENVQRHKTKLIEYGKKNKIARICWNDEGWKFPSGSKGKSVTKSSYERQFGFGHEEWLFDRSKVIDGYHYSFLQPLNVESGKHIGNQYNIGLYTKNNLNIWYYVGEINEVDCISRDESKDVYKVYRSNGWIDEMKEQVEKVGGKWESNIATSPELLFNIRFRFDKVTLLNELEEIDPSDINLSTYHFKLLPRRTNFSIATVNDDDSDEGNRRNTKTRNKVFNSATSYDPFHDMIQNALFDYLKESDDYRNVKIEKDRVDLKAQFTDDNWHYFEVKTDNPKLSIRKAIGQIMEYAYYPDLAKASKLYVIAGELPDSNTISYLKHIRFKFNIPIYYQCFNIEGNTLSAEY